MEPPKEDLRQASEPSQETRPSRFHIEKLEERVAPRIGRYHYPGWYNHGPPYPPGHTK